jgi:hypothetical protein
MSENVTSGKVALSGYKTKPLDGQNRLCQNPSRANSDGTLIVARVVAQVSNTLK